MTNSTPRTIACGGVEFFSVDDTAPTCTITRQASDTTVGYNLRNPKTVTVRPHDTVFVPIGYRVALPPDTFGKIEPRLKFFKKNRLYVFPGIIDRDDVGIVVGLANYGPRSVTVSAHTKIAQLVLYTSPLRALSNPGLVEVSKKDYIASAVAVPSDALKRHEDVTGDRSDEEPAARKKMKAAASTPTTASTPPSSPLTQALPADDNAQEIAKDDDDDDDAGDGDGGRSM